MTLTMGLMAFLDMLKRVAISSCVERRRFRNDQVVRYSIYWGDFSCVDECKDLSIMGEASVVARTASPATG